MTYADRREFLTRVINKLVNNTDVELIFIIGNDPAYDFENYVQSIDSYKIRHYRFDMNTGSAMGYKHGIMMAEAEHAVKYIWLLDDDNLPDDNALTIMLKLIKGDEKASFLPLRKDRQYLLKAAEGYPVKFLFPQINSFLGFHLLYFFQRRLFFKKSISSHHLNKVKIPMAPYGGLFFNKSFLPEIGYPDERFYLYGDDIEFTYRITKAGYSIYLLTNIRVDDIDTSWVTKDTRPGVKYLYQNDFRAWFSARNSSFYSKYSLRQNNFMFWLNKSVYMLILGLVSVLKGKKREFGKFRQMVRAGLDAKFDNEAILKMRNDQST